MKLIYNGPLPHLQILDGATIIPAERGQVVEVSDESAKVLLEREGWSTATVKAAKEVK